MSLFKFLDLETISTCNRRCSTCIRNSHPDREAVQSWFEPNYLPIEVIKEALDQCEKLDFRGGVCLSHYNEPLMDERLPEIVRLAKSYGRFYVFLNTNGDFLTEELARQLDGSLDQIIVSLYMDEPVKSKRAEWIRSLFHKTQADPKIYSDHVPTHFSPKFDVERLAQEYIDRTCLDPSLHCIINHRRQYLLCCDDVIGNFDLGYFPDKSIEDYWFGEPHKTLMNNLLIDGGRRQHSYCATCPRG